MKFASKAVQDHLSLLHIPKLSLVAMKSAVNFENGLICWDWLADDMAEAEILRGNVVRVKQLASASLEAWRYIFENVYHIGLSESEKLNNTMDAVLNWLFIEKRADVVGLLVVPMIERILFGLSEIEVDEKGCIGSASLLRHVLEAPPSILSSACIGLLRILFLPSDDGLNLRNMLWHGFLDDNDFAPEYAALFISCWLTIGKYEQSLTSMEMPQCPSVLDLKDDVHFEFFSDFVLQPDSVLPWERDCQSRFPDPSRRTAATMGVNMARAGKNVTALAILVPLVLEHGLRNLFQLSNRQSLKDVDITVAEKGMYFTTLDGYGQRDRHNVMLCRNMDSGERNNLLEYLPRGVVALLLDMFLYQEGPGIRSMIAHGYWNLELENEIAVRDQLQVATTAVVCAIVCISAQSAKNVPEHSSFWNHYLHEYKSKFHPHSLVNYRMECVKTVFHALEEFVTSRIVQPSNVQTDSINVNRIDGDRGLNDEIQLYSISWGGGTIGTMTNLSKVAEDLNNSALTFNESISTARRVLGSLCKGDLSCNFSSLPDANTASNYKEYLQTLQEAENVCKYLLNDISDLETAVLSRSARTGHRKSLIKSLLLLPPFYSAISFGCDVAVYGLYLGAKLQDGDAFQVGVSSFLLAFNSVCKGICPSNSQNKGKNSAKQDIIKSMQRLTKVLRAKRIQRALELFNNQIQSTQLSTLETK